MWRVKSWREIIKKISQKWQESICTKTHQIKNKDTPPPISSLGWGVYDSLSHANSLIGIVPGWSVSYFLSHISYFHFDIIYFYFQFCFKKRAKKLAVVIHRFSILPSLNLKKIILLVNFKWLVKQWWGCWLDLR